MNLKLIWRLLGNSVYRVISQLHRFNFAPRWSKTVVGFVVLVSLGMITVITLPEKSQDVSEVQPPKIAQKAK